MKPLFVALDLEFNQPSQKIIQIGAVVADIRTSSVLSRFSVFVNPSEPLNPEIADLCGIAPEVLAMAGDLAEGCEQLTAWLAPFAAERQLNPLTWGGGDSLQLREQAGARDERWLFGRRWLDVKTVFAAYMHSEGKDASGGLGASMKKVGLLFQGRPHDAAADAHNTALMYFQVLRRLRTPATARKD